MSVRLSAPRVAITVLTMAILSIHESGCVPPVRCRRPQPFPLRPRTESCASGVPSPATAANAGFRAAASVAARRDRLRWATVPSAATVDHVGLARFLASGHVRLERADGDVVDAVAIHVAGRAHRVTRVV